MKDDSDNIIRRIPCLTRYPKWGSTETFILGLINSCPVGLTALSVRENSCLLLYSQLLIACEVIGKTTIIIFLNEHNLKLYSKY